MYWLRINRWKTQIEILSSFILIFGVEMKLHISRKVGLDIECYVALFKHFHLIIADLWIINYQSSILFCGFTFDRCLRKHTQTNTYWHTSLYLFTHSIELSNWNLDWVMREIQFYPFIPPFIFLNNIVK